MKILRENVSAGELIPPLWAGSRLPAYVFAEQRCARIALALLSETPNGQTRRADVFPDPLNREAIARFAHDRRRRDKERDDELACLGAQCDRSSHVVRCRVGAPRP